MDRDQPTTRPGWTSRTVNLDQFSRVLSHELVDLMPDWDDDGFKVDSSTPAPAGSGNQMADYECNSYYFRLSNGVDVQPAWSRQDSYFGTAGAFAVYDGTNQKFFLDPSGPAASPNWTNTPQGWSFNGQYALTIQGDQTGTDDVITVGTGPNGGVQITQNGETINFDPNQITGITINAKTGSTRSTSTRCRRGVT